MKKIGITGAAGNVGTSIREGLKESYQLTLFDIKDIKTSPGQQEAIKVDFNARESIAGIFKGLDVVIHLAGDPRPNAPQQSTLRNNFVSTSYVFEEAYVSGVKKIVFASSNFYHETDISNALSSGTKNMIKLGSPPTPRSLYGKSKVFGEEVGRHYSYLGMQFVALRIGWTVPEDNPRYYGGEYMQSMFISHRDLVQAFEKSIETTRPFVTAFAISNNTTKIFDLTETRELLGFHPLDDSDKY